MLLSGFCFVSACSSSNTLSVATLVKTSTRYDCSFHKADGDYTIIQSMAYPLDTSITSTGKVKGFQTVTGGLLMLNLPFSYWLLKIGYPPESTMYVAIIMLCIAHLSRMWFAKKEAGVEIIRYCKEVLLVVLIVALGVFFPLAWLYGLFDFERFLPFCIFSIICLIWSCIVIYIIGITSQERQQLKAFLLQKMNHK